MDIETGCRLHLSLIDLNGEIGRVDGGIGLSLESPGVKISGELSDSLSVSGPQADRVHDAASNVLEEIGGGPVRLHVQSTIPQHIGLGSGTQLALAAGKITSELNGEALSSKEIARLTGRAGTSGIGTAAFESGGFILDGGHDFDKKDGFLPSSASDSSPPPVLSRLEFPDWNIRIFVPDGKGAHDRSEIDVFSEVCPIPRHDVEKLCHVIVMKLLPSIQDCNFQDFRDSITTIQELGFKQEELSYQPRSQEIISKLHSEGYAAGLSSFGPAIYAISPSKIERTFQDCRIIDAEVDYEGGVVSH